MLLQRQSTHGAKSMKMKNNWRAVATSAWILLLGLCIFQISVATVAINKLERQKLHLELDRLNEVMDAKKDSLRSRGEDGDLIAIIDLANQGQQFILKGLHDNRASSVACGILVLIGLTGHIKMK